MMVRDFGSVPFKFVPTHRHSRESGNPVSLPSAILPQRSFQYGFTDSISSIFHVRRRFLMRFSRVIAESIVWCNSYHTRFVMPWDARSEEHTSELQSLMRISY